MEINLQKKSLDVELETNAVEKHPPIMKQR